jgi:hypothetical protein
MSTKFAAAVAIGTLAFVSAPLEADAGGKRRAERADESTAYRDCTPINGPNAYYGNPWCDGGWKYAEDYPPGTGPFLDLLDLPQVQRLRRRWE